MRNNTRLLALIAALSAANVVFRVGLAGGPPNVKPTAFLVIVGGIVAGPIPGLLIGWLSMSISDLATPLGAGFWTIETSAGMATVGLLAGLLLHKSDKVGRVRFGLVGFLLTVFYDVGTAIVDALIYNYPWWVSLMGLYVPFLVGFSPYPFGLVHEATTAVLCAAVGPSLIRRIRKLYR